MIQSRFDTISPIDSRFYGGDATLYKSLHPYLSAAAAIRYQARVEGALAQAMADAGICDRATADRSHARRIGSFRRRSPRRRRRRGTTCALS